MFVLYGVPFGVGSGKDEQEASSAKETSVPQKKRKKRKIRESPHADSGTTDGNSEEGIAETSGSVILNPGKMPDNKKMKKKKKLLVNETNEIRNAVSDTGDKHSVSAQSSQTDTEQSKKIQSEKMNPKVQNVLGKLECQNGPANAKKAEDVNTSLTPLIPKVGKKKQKAGSALVNGENFSQQTDLKCNKEGTLSRDVDSESEPSRKVKLKKKTKLVALEGIEVSNQKAATLKKKRKVKEVLNSVEANGILETACKKSKKEVCKSLCFFSPLPFALFTNFQAIFYIWPAVTKRTSFPKILSPQLHSYTFSHYNIRACASNPCERIHVTETCLVRVWSSLCCWLELFVSFLISPLSSLLICTGSLNKHVCNLGISWQKDGNAKMEHYSSSNTVSLD